MYGCSATDLDSLKRDVDPQTQHSGFLQTASRRRHRQSQEATTSCTGPKAAARRTCGEGPSGTLQHPTSRRGERCGGLSISSAVAIRNRANSRRTQRQEEEEEVGG